VIEPHRDLIATPFELSGHFLPRMKTGIRRPTVPIQLGFIERLTAAVVAVIAIARSR
jgi:hypothetical protein